MAVPTVSVDSKGERQLKDAPKPNVTAELPAVLKLQDTIRFDPSMYRLREEAARLLDVAGPKVGFGKFPNGPADLEEFSACESVFSSFKFEKHWRQCVASAEEFLEEYERLVCEVVCPHMKSLMGVEAADKRTTFFYQFPPTLRLQPGPSKQYRRVHRDAEYGHQDGEVNFWLPLTDMAKTGVTLWTEETPDADDFRAVDLNIGDICMFHGTLCRHYVPANESTHTRVSMDFRIGVDDCFDEAWTLKGIQHVHPRRRIVL
mmetsp:Transcript_13898/g.21076  ORF Transcript_13898/g.21076 Transcript_13898/m.21076 type:complete len:260 (+) Transcript_13898:66-845(+)